MTTPRSLSDMLPIAVGAIEIARDLITGSVAGIVTAKGDRDMVSELDFAVERTVRTFLAEGTPAVGFLGEEEGVTGPEGDLHWVLDPIDGTANLLHGLPLCAVSLALVDAKRPVLGVIDLPFLGERYTAVDGQGAYAGGVPIRTSDTGSLTDAVVSLGDYAVGDGAESKNRARLAVTELLAGRAQRVRMFGTAAIDLAWLACGRTDAVMMLSNKPWDTAAGVVIAREAGALVVDLAGAPHTLDSSATLAAGPGVIGAIVELAQHALSGSREREGR